MVDAALPLKSDLPLGVLFLDLNAYFASVEQQVDPSLRGKPIIVAPAPGDNTVAIAASYEAKKYGIKTGTKVGDARLMCPDLLIVAGHHTLYTHYHNKVIEATQTVLPVDKVCSIDEMQCRLLGVERTPEGATKMALKIKAAIKEMAGECLTCSIGIAPNGFLAKLASDMQKPDGLVILEAKDLPEKVNHLELTDFAGINKRMAARLNAAGIFTVPDLYNATPAEMRGAFGSITGERWWYLIRGHSLELQETERKSLSHSSVLSPHRRSDDGSRQVMLRLIQKASARLRSEDLWASGMSIHVKGFKKLWKAHMRLDPSQDTVAFNEAFMRMWRTREFDKPIQVGVVFYDLSETEGITPSLFSNEMERAKLNKAVDVVNQKFGKNTVYLAGMEGAKDSATEKIAFNKTWLFSEGKGDNLWSEEDED